jgi:hypothetical protein
MGTPSLCKEGQEQGRNSQEQEIGSENGTRVSRLSGRGGLRRIVRQAGSSNPKGGAGKEEDQRNQDVRSSGCRGGERPPIRRKPVQGISGYNVYE